MPEHVRGPFSDASRSDTERWFRDTLGRLDARVEMLEREVGRVPELEREVAELRARLAEEERAEAILRRASGASAQRRPRPPGEATFLRVVRLVALAAIGAAVIAAATGHSGQVRHRAVPRCAVACHRLPGRQERAADLG